MNQRNRGARDFLPPLAGLVLVVLFVSLGLWQLDRAEEKRSIETAFSGGGDLRTVTRDVEYSLYQPMQASGQWVGERQFLIDNMILDGRIGYYLVTPFEYERGAPLLLVNRGWLPKTGGGTTASAALAVEPGVVTVTGKASQLPRVGIRAGEAFVDRSGWPRVANWPSLDELADALGHEVLPFVLLADPEPGSSLVRQWQPRQAGPMRHVGYAVQWFGLAAAVIVVAVVLLRRRRTSG